MSSIINVVTYPGIMRAFDPSRAVMCKSRTTLTPAVTDNPIPDFVRTKNYDALAGVLLSLTGCEAVL